MFRDTKNTNLNVEMHCHPLSVNPGMQEVQDLVLPAQVKQGSSQAIHTFCAPEMALVLKVCPGVQVRQLASDEQVAHPVAQALQVLLATVR